MTFIFISETDKNQDFNKFFIAVVRPTYIDT